MDEGVLRSMAKWPDVPDVYGWLALDRRGHWRLRDEAGAFGRIGNAALREFIGRNYAADPRGAWYFQNGPQRVYVRLEYTPLVARLAGEGLEDHCGRPFSPVAAWLDDEGSLLLAGSPGIALLDDRDLAAYAERHPGGVAGLPAIPRAAVPARFGFLPDPAP